MNKEELEKAAQRHADAVRCYEDRKLHCKEDFIAGAECAVNCIWHTGDERPKAENETGYAFIAIIVGYGDDTTMICISCPTGSAKWWEDRNVRYWTYIKDLMPKTIINV